MGKPASEVVSKSVFTTGEVAQLLGASPFMVAKWHDAGLLKGYRLPPKNLHRRFPRESVIAFCRRHGIAAAGLYEPAAQSEEP